MNLRICLKVSGQLRDHPVVRLLCSQLNLTHSCGYVSLIRVNNGTNATVPTASGEGSSNTRLVECYENASGTPMGGSEGPFGQRGSSTRDPRKVPSRAPAHTDSYAAWTVFDCVYGVPLFDRQLSRAVAANIQQFNLFSTEKFVKK